MGKKVAAIICRGLLLKFFDMLLLKKYPAPQSERVIIIKELPRGGYVARAVVVRPSVRDQVGSLLTSIVLFLIKQIGIPILVNWIVLVLHSITAV